MPAECKFFFHGLNVEKKNNKRGILFGARLNRRLQEAALCALELGGCSSMSASASAASVKVPLHVRG